jgi:hypothetical protein
LYLFGVRSEVVLIKATPVSSHNAASFELAIATLGVIDGARPFS